MTKALILGALAGQVDAIATLRKRGVETHSCAHLRSGPGVQAADHFHVADITSVEDVGDLARSIEADIVYSVGSDIAMPTVVKVSEALGLPYFHGTELTNVLRRKELMRERLRAADLSPVDFVAVQSDEPVPTWSSFPCIVKPVDAQGQRGITIVEEHAHLAEAIDVARASAVSGSVIVEELLQGPEVSAHVLVNDGEIILFVPSDRHVWEGPLVGIPKAHSLPLGEATRGAHDAFRKLTKAVIAELNVREGPLYVQAIVTPQGPRIVEIASRLDGCHLWRLLKHSTGIDLMDMVLGRLLGEPWPALPDAVEPTPSTLEFFLGPPDGTVTAAEAAGMTRPDAVYSEMQLEPDGLPRRTNSIVSRLGYQIYENN